MENTTHKYFSLFIIVWGKIKGKSIYNHKVKKRLRSDLPAFFLQIEHKGFDSSQEDWDLLLIPQSLWWEQDQITL
jgi:hypothetical protein